MPDRPRRRIRRRLLTATEAVNGGTVEPMRFPNGHFSHVLCKRQRRSGHAPGAVRHGARHRGADLVFRLGHLVNLAMATTSGLAGGDGDAGGARQTVGCIWAIIARSSPPGCWRWRCRRWRRGG
jgi:hypothetical protein